MSRLKAHDLRQGITTLSQAQIEDFKPYSFYAAAAYCNPSNTLTWSCGGYVGWDPTLSSVVVAHQGTNPTSILADLTDIDVFMTNLDSTLFPGLPSSIQVHSGFAAEHAKTAQTILAQHGASSVTVTGHSLGAALALLDAVYLPLHLPAGTRVRMVGYGMPRVGNAASPPAHSHLRTSITARTPSRSCRGASWASHIPTGEVHIRDTDAWVACPGRDNPSTLCTVGDVPDVLHGNILNHLGPYDDGIFMGLC
ncbi:lipase [Lactarius indigo]|nr:lipase [Lactarius indigo]